MTGSGSRQRILDLVSDRIIGITTGRRALAALAGALVLGFVINSRPFGVAELKSMTGGIGILDLEFLYSPSQAYLHLAAMGDAGRAFELTHIIPLDFLFAVVYTLAYSLIITWLLQQWLHKESRWHRLNVVPVIGGICDYLENFGIIVMLLAWPVQVPDIAIFTMVAGFFKFMFGAFAFVVIIGALTGWAVHAVRGRGVRTPAAGSGDNV